jgi:outer membrane protein assembly factor BamA
MRQGSSFSRRRVGGRRSIVVVIFFLASIVPFGPAFAAQGPTEGSGRLQSIQVTGSTRFQSEQIAQAMGLHAGAMITRDDLQKGANFLAQLGPFTSVEYRYGTTDAGVTAEYHVKDAPAVPVRFDNFPWFSDDDLSAALEKSVVLFDGTAPEHGTILDSMANALDTMLVAHGLHTGVSHTLTNAPFGNQQIQEFHADDSPVTVKSIQFTDPLAQNDRGVQSRLEDLIGKPYSRSAIELFELEQVEPLYLSRSLLHVQFGPPNGKVSRSGESSEIAVIAPIDPGIAFTWSGVTWTGNAAISSAELNVYVPFKAGDPADGMKIQAAWNTIHDAYTRRGYLDVNLVPTPQLDADNKRVSYTVAVSEGPQYHMGQLILSGLSVEGERRIRGAWKIPQGGVLDESVYDAFFTDGIEQAFQGFPFHYEKIGHFLQKDPKTGTADVLIDFQ